MASKFDVILPFDGQYLSIHDEISEAAGVALILQMQEFGTVRSTEESVAPGPDKNFGYGTRTRIDGSSEQNGQWESAPAAGEKTYVRAMDGKNVLTVQTA